jgi:hypothetical protein
MNIKQISYKNDELNGSKLVLNFKGEKVVYQIMNSLRQGCINLPAIYSFHPSKINIITNTTVYDNTETKLRISQLPITNINSDVTFLEDNYYKNVNFSEDYELHPDDNDIIEMYIKKKNKTLEIMYVSTNDLIIKINNKLVDIEKMYSKKYPILLSKLRMDEEIECSMKSVLATGDLSSIFNASNCYWEQLAENEYIFSIESSGQKKESDIIINVCEIIIEKMKILKNNFKNEQYQIATFSKNKVIIEIYNEGYITFGPINYMLQSLKDIKRSGISRTSYLEKKIQLTVESYENNPLDNIFIAIDQCIDLFKDIQKQLTKVLKKTK